MPWIGHRIDAFDVDDSSEPYTARSRSVFVPPMRTIGSGTPDHWGPGTGITHGDYEAIRPVDVRSSPVDGSLLFTADRDDFMKPTVGHNAGGLYRIIHGPAAPAEDERERSVEGHEDDVRLAHVLDALGVLEQRAATRRSRAAPPRPPASEQLLPLMHVDAHARRASSTPRCCLRTWARRRRAPWRVGVVPRRRPTRVSVALHARPYVMGR